jgi:hypothetical protein
MELRIGFDGPTSPADPLESATTASFDVRRSSAKVTLLDAQCRRGGPAFTWLADYIKSSPPFVELKERRSNIKRDLGLP